MFRHVLLLTVWLGPNVFACPEGWWRSRATDGLCLTQLRQDGILIQDSWTELHWRCRRLGATLAGIRTTDELEELIALVPEKSWIGLASFDPAGKWQWIRGSSSMEWPLANTTLFWGNENKPTFGRLRCGSLRSNGTIVVSHCGSWQTGVCELRLDEPKVPDLPQCIDKHVNSIQNESVCYLDGGAYVFKSDCDYRFKTYVLPTSFADIESMLTLGAPCQDDLCFHGGNFILVLPVRRLSNTDHWLNAYTNASVNWTNWLQPNITGDTDCNFMPCDCAILNDDGFWERQSCKTSDGESTRPLRHDAVVPSILMICVGGLEADTPSAASPTTVAPPPPPPLEAGRARPFCPPGARLVNAILYQGWTCIILSSDRLPWAAAGQRCRAMGGSLITQLNLYRDIITTEHQGDGIWVGNAALSDQWAWNQNRGDGAGWLPRDVGRDGAWGGTKPKIIENGRILCASTDIEGNKTNAENCGRSLRYVCEVDAVESSLAVPTCRWNSHILTSDPTSCLSVTYRNFSYKNLNETCSKLGGSPFLPSSKLENEILLANGQAWNENSTSAPALGHDLVWLGFRLGSSVWNYPTFRTKWAPGHPQGQVECAVVDASNGLWYSLDCHDPRPSGVCRVPTGFPLTPLHG